MNTNNNKDCLKFWICYLIKYYNYLKLCSTWLQYFTATIFVQNKLQALQQNKLWTCKLQRSSGNFNITKSNGQRKWNKNVTVISQDLK